MPTSGAGLNGLICVKHSGQDLVGSKDYKMLTVIPILMFQTEIHDWH